LEINEKNALHAYSKRSLGGIAHARCIWNSESIGFCACSQIEAPPTQQAAHQAVQQKQKDDEEEEEEEETEVTATAAGLPVVSEAKEEKKQVPRVMPIQDKTKLSLKDFDMLALIGRGTYVCTFVRALIGLSFHSSSSFTHEHE
jgi:hypothetical protein